MAIEFGGSARPTTPQRRYLTILFCDLVNYTELSEQLDPEDLRDILESQYRRCALSVAEKYGGVVTSFGGDGILAYFGYPVAHENDAERAVRAALELVERVPALDVAVRGLKLAPLGVRIAIHTGLAVIGPDSASMGQVEHGVIGQTANVAARLQSEAATNSVVVSQDTLQLIEGLFEVEAIGARSLKGLSRPVDAYKVVSARHATSGLKSRGRRSTTKLVGRQGELERLLLHWRTTIRDGRCNTIHVLGEAGVGKTRLVLELCQHPDLAAATVLQAHCLEIFASTPFYPLANLLWAGANLAATDSEDARRRKITALLSQLDADLPANLELIEHLLGLAPSVGAAPLGPTPYLVRRKQNALFVSLIDRLAQAKPLMLWIEDAHWLDPSSAELLQEIIDQVVGRPLFIVVTLRSFPKGPELPAADDTVRLSQLTVQECLELARSVPGARSVPETYLSQAVEASDGIPLHIEQLVLAMISKDAKRSGAADPLPLTLAEIMSERLDRLEGGRQVVQAAACIGRSFMPEFLAALLGATPRAFTGPLEALVEAEIFRRRNLGGDVAYEFRHVLLQRVAYESMLQFERQTMHSRIIDLLRSGFDAGPTAPEALAHHLTAAGRFEEAVKAWLDAGVSASRRSAQTEALAHLRRGLGLLDEIKDPILRRRLELDLQAALIGPLTATRGATSEEFSACCQRGLELATSGDPTPLVFPFVFGEFTFAIGRAHIRKARALAQHFLSLANHASYASGQVVAHRLMGMALLSECEAETAKEHLERSLALYSPERDETATHMYGQNTQVHSGALLSLTLFLLGDIDHSFEVGLSALQSADSLRHPHSTAIALGYVGCWVLGLCGAKEELMRGARRLIAHSEQHGLGMFRTTGTAFLGWALCQQGDLEQGIAVLEQAIDDLEASGFRLTLSAHLAALADAKRRIGQLRRAEALSARAVQTVAEGGDVRWLEPEVRRIAALVTHAQHPREQAAEGELRKAVECARAYRLPVFELSCLTSLAQLVGPDRLDDTSGARMRELAHLRALDVRATRAVRVRAPVLAGSEIGGD